MHVEAAVLSAFGQPFEVTTLDIAAPTADEVLVRLSAVGICHSDVVCQHGGFAPPLPIVLGHEGAGVVEQVGANVTGLVPGDHVVLSYASCGGCGPCNEGQPQYCLQFGVRNFKGFRPGGVQPSYHDAGGNDVWGGFFGQSSFATYALATQRNTVKVSKSLPIELLGPLGCGLMTGSGTVLNTLKPRPGSSLAVFGVGTVGMAALMAAKVSGCARIIAIDVHDGRLQLARELGATDVLRGDSDDLAGQLKALVKGGIDYTVDTSGRAEAMTAAINCLAQRGTCAVVAVSGATEVTFTPALLLGGRKIVGATEGDADPQQFIPHLLDLFEAGQFPFDRLVTFYDLAGINTAISDMHHGTTIKPILRLSH